MSQLVPVRGKSKKTTESRVSVPAESKTTRTPEPKNTIESPIYKTLRDQFFEKKINIKTFGIQLQRLMKSHPRAYESFKHDLRNFTAKDIKKLKRVFHPDKALGWENALKHLNDTTESRQTFIRSHWSLLTKYRDILIKRSKKTKDNINARKHEVSDILNNIHRKRPTVPSHSTPSKYNTRVEDILNGIEGTRQVKHINRGGENNDADVEDILNHTHRTNRIARVMHHLVPPADMTAQTILENLQPTRRRPAGSKHQDDADVTNILQSVHKSRFKKDQEVYFKHYHYNADGKTKYAKGTIQKVKGSDYDVLMEFETTMFFMNGLFPQVHANETYDQRKYQYFSDVNENDLAPVEKFEENENVCVDGESGLIQTVLDPVKGTYMINGKPVDESHISYCKMRYRAGQYVTWCIRFYVSVIEPYYGDVNMKLNYYSTGTIIKKPSIYDGQPFDTIDLHMRVKIKKTHPKTRKYTITLDGIEFFPYINKFIQHMRLKFHSNSLKEKIMNIIRNRTMVAERYLKPVFADLDCTYEEYDPDYPNGAPDAYADSGGGRDTLTPFNFNGDLSYGGELKFEFVHK